MNDIDAVRKLLQWERQRMRVQHRKAVRELKKHFAYIAFLLGLLFVFHMLVLTYEAKATELCKLALSKVSVHLDKIKGNETQLSIRVGSDPAAYYRYRMLTDTRADISGMFTLDSFKGQGLSSIFVATMLRREQTIKEIQAVLMLDNLEASGLTYIKRDVTDSECKLAVTRTPFVKTFSKFGFAVDTCRFSRVTSLLELEMSK